ncbi:MAG: hypothetical protein LAP85_01605 [Acidobacteriia bacterium]|nr:hypothetical protein [Terriglobia bacterium]
MNNPGLKIWWALAFILFPARPHLAAGQAVPILANEFLRAEFSASRLTALVDARTGFRVRFADEAFSLTVAGEKITAQNLTWIDMMGSNWRVSVSYRGSHFTVDVIYELSPGCRFLSKQIVVQPLDPADYRVNEVEAFAARIEPASRQEVPLTRGTWGTLLRFGEGSAVSSRQAFGAFFLYQNPFNVWKKDGEVMSASYAPEIDWKSAYGPYASDRFLIGLYPLSGSVFLARAVPEWTYVPDYQRYLTENPLIDMAEVDALVDCVHWFLPYRPHKSIRVHVPWCENDYQIDVATAEGWQEFRRIIDRASELGCQYTLFTPANSSLSSLAENRDAWGWENLLFFAMGQKIRKGEWDPARDPIPQSLQQTLDYARSKNIKLVAYAYPSLPFMQNPEWTRWAAGKVGGYNGPDMGLRSFQDWWVDKLVDFVSATGAGGFSFDHWWIAYDNASSKYAQWNGCRRILETLRRRLPDIVIDGRQQYMNFGPWTWLAGSYPHPSLTDEQPESFVSFPDLHTDRVSADRQRFAAWTYRMQRFCPPEILPGFMTHQTERSDAKKVMRRDRFRPRDWDVLGWKFSVLSSIGTAPFNHVIDYIPARDPDEFKAFSEEDKRWFRAWLDWTDTNEAILRRIKPIIGPPMIGRVDGTAACEGDRGFVFLFNPNYRVVNAEFALDGSIGLEKGSLFFLEELYPEKGRLIGHPQSGIWKSGARLVLPMAGNTAVVLAIRPAAPAMPQPVLFGVRGRAAVTGNRLALVGIEGEAGSEREIAVMLPGDTRMISVTASGTRVQFQQAGNMVFARIRFAGEAFTRSQPLWAYDPAFAGGTIKAAFKIPARILDQLRRRQQAWPVPYTEDDLIAPWLGSHRLLLYAHTAEPDDSREVTMTIDGKPVQVRKAYNNIYGNNKRNFLGSYADISSLEPGVKHVIEVTVPQIAQGRFQGLFFENVEPEYTNKVVARR